MATLKEKLALGEQYGMHLNFWRMTLYPLAGDDYDGNVSEFERLGIQIDEAQNISFMKVPICGSTTFLQELAAKTQEELSKVFALLVKLPNARVAW